jgi:hypothetical protein
VSVAIFNRSESSTPGPGHEPAGESPAASPTRGSSGSELKRVVEGAAQRVDEIVDGAERVAAEIIADAEAEGTRYVEDRRREADEVMDQWSADLRGLAELLGRQESRLRDLTQSMIGELEEIAAVLRAIPPEIARSREAPPRPRGPAGPESPAPEPSPVPPPPPQSAAPQRGEPAADRAGEPGEGERPHGREHALLRAAQMAVAGSSREEIERALRAELGIGDPGPIVDELLGAQP